MNILVLFAHPVDTSFQAALHRRAIGALTARGHAVDDCDLYAEAFDPRLSRAERLAYHEPDSDRSDIQPHIDRLRAAEALVLIFPVWNHGYPAILKGYFDRVFLPDVSFRMEDGQAVPMLRHLKRTAAIATYGGSRLRATLLGDPVRKSVTRVLRAQTVGTPLRYLAQYDMNRSDDAARQRFLARVAAEMERFG